MANLSLFLDRPAVNRRISVKIESPDIILVNDIEDRLVFTLNTLCKEIMIK